MKKGISAWAFPGGMPIKEIFSEAKKYGFDGVELAMDFGGELNPETTSEKLAEIKADAEKAGIELYSIASGCYWHKSLTSDDKEQQNEAKALVKKQIEIAAALGCETILVLPGHVGVDFAPALGVVEYDVAFERAVCAAKELAEFAKEHGVVIGMENVWNKFLTSPLDMKNFIDEVGSEYVRSYFDVGNVLYNGYPEHWIKILGKRIAKVHFKDFNVGIGNITAFCDLLCGNVNYPAVKKALDEIGYDGWVTAEVSPYALDNSVMLNHTSLAMDAIFKM